MTRFLWLSKSRVMVTVAAAPAMATAISARPAAAQTMDYKRACPIGEPGTMACMALIRTGVHAAGIRLAGPVPGAYTPADLAAAYHLDTTGGAGRTVAIVDAYDDPNAESD